VLLDDRTGSYPGADAADMEDAIEVAASLAMAAANGDHGVRLLTVCGQLDLEHLATPGVPGGLSARSLVAGLAEVTAREADRQPAPIPVSALDIVVVVTGTAADLGPLAAEAGRAALGVVAVVDRDPLAGPVVATGPVTVLRGPTSERLLAVWDSVVAR
jgi:hypothetical protein